MNAKTMWSRFCAAGLAGFVGTLATLTWMRRTAQGADLPLRYDDFHVHYPVTGIVRAWRSGPSAVLRGTRVGDPLIPWRKSLRSSEQSAVDYRVDEVLWTDGTLHEGQTVTVWFLPSADAVPVLPERAMLAVCDLEILGTTTRCSFPFMRAEAGILPENLAGTDARSFFKSLTGQVDRPRGGRASALDAVLIARRAASELPTAPFDHELDSLEDYPFGWRVRICFLEDPIEEIDPQSVDFLSQNERALDFWLDHRGHVHASRESRAW